MESSKPPNRSSPPQQGSAAPPRASAVPPRASALPPRPRSGVPGEADDNEARLGNSERTRAAGDALRALAKASRSYLIYDASNAAVRGFIEEVRARFAHYLGTYGDMVLMVRPFELMLDGEAVYLERDRERSLALKLFRDGVRKLTVERDTDWGELTRLLEILSIRFVGVRMNEDDVVTLLWKAGFAHIRIEAVEGFVPDDDEEPVLTGGGGEVAQESAGARAAGQIFGTDSTRVGDVASSHVPDDFDLPMPKLPPPTQVRYVPLRPERVEALKAEADSTQLPEATLALTRELLDVADSPTDPMAFEEMVNFVKEVRDFLLSEDRLDALLSLYDALASYRDHTPADRERVAEVLTGFVDATAVRKLIRSVPKDMPEPPERLRLMLARVPGDVLSMLMDLLATERDDHERRTLRHLIAQHLPKRIQALVERLRVSTGPVAADLLRVLAHAAPDAATQVLASLTAGGDTEVQHEFLRLASDMAPTPQLRGQLTLMLGASAADVREHALRVIAARGEKGAFPTVLRHADARAEAGAPPTEMAAIGRAMARIDPARALEVLGDWAVPKGFFAKLFQSKPAQMRGHAAVWGLAALGTPEAEALLQVVAARGEVELREAVRAATERPKSGRPE